jgi:hypothetical protein
MKPMEAVSGVCRAPLPELDMPMKYNPNFDVGSVLDTLRTVNE